VKRRNTLTEMSSLNTRGRNNLDNYGFENPVVARQASDRLFREHDHDAGFDDFCEFFRIPVCKTYTAMARCFADA